MLEKVDPKVDFIALEHEILSFWKEKNTFRKRVEANRGKPRWSFLDGPITANNPMGVHHAWGRTYKDIFQRYRAMKGYDLRYQNGFDCQGLWVEVEVEKELGFKSKTDIEEFGIEKFVNACKERVWKFSKIQTDQSIRLGYWMDWDNSYYTMSDENNYTIWYFLKKCHERGWIYKGNDVMPWCIDCGAAMSEHEIATEGYVEKSHLSLYVRFPLKGRGNESLLVWTTTPWTLTSNVAAAVHPEMDYLKVMQGGESLYLVETRAEVLKEKGDFEIVRKVKGAELVGQYYEGPFDRFEAQEKVDHVVIAWEGVNDTEGTGIVHVAPGCGHEDFLLSKEERLAVIAPLDQFGNYLAGFGYLTGKNVRDVSGEIVADLKRQGKLYKREQYLHRYPICWRHKTDLVFRLVDEWFISTDELRREIMAVTEKIRWMPAWGVDRELEWLRSMDDWMISKKRYWGLALPIYECQGCGRVTVIGGYEELRERAVEGWEEFDSGSDGQRHSPHRPWIDAVKIQCEGCGEKVSRIQDVGNPWLDAGIVPFSTLHYRQDKEYWKRWFPADFITECFPGQFRNWFYSLLTMSTVLENKPPFKAVLGHALVKDEHGNDMHKSAGNAIWFDDAAERMGVDVMRWIFAAQNPEQNLLFGYGPAREIRKRLITLWNVYSFFATYARLDHFDPASVTTDGESFTDLDRWITSKLNEIVRLADQAYDAFRVDRLMRNVDRFLDDLSNWYVRRNRRRFWKSENDRDKNAAYFTLYRVLVNLVKVLAPIVPFVTEKIYQNLVLNLDSEQPESVHLCDFPTFNDSEIDQKIVAEIDSVVKIVELGRYARNKANLKIRQPLAKLQFSVSNQEVATAIHRNSHLIREELNVKEVEQVDSASDLIEYELHPNLPLIGRRIGKDLQRVKDILTKVSYEDIAGELSGSGPIVLSYNGDEVELFKEEIIVNESSADGKSAASDNGITVAVTTVLTEELVEEGMVRDMIRQVQNMRKEAGLNVEDRIVVRYAMDPELKSALLNFRDYFCSEVLAVNLDTGPETGGFAKEVKIRGKKVIFEISKVSVN